LIAKISDAFPPGGINDPFVTVAALGVTAVTLVTFSPTTVVGVSTAVFAAAIGAADPFVLAVDEAGLGVGVVMLVATAL
jgi:hypothetical protein